MAWVHQKLAAHKGSSRDNVFRRPEFVDGESFYYLGKHYRLKLADVARRGAAGPDSPFCWRSTTVQARAVAGRRTRTAEYYTRAAHPFLNPSITRWKSIVGAEPARYVQVKDLGYKWGSNSRRNVERGSLERRRCPVRA